MSFQKDFLWGAATAAPQIEGGWDCDGRTPSIWDQPPEGKIKNGDTPQKACDHYHRMKEDVALMQEIGLKSYRFSISWSRVIPEEGKVNEKGLQFYIDLVTELKRDRAACYDLSLGSSRLGGKAGRLAFQKNHPALCGVYPRGGGSSF